MSIMSRAEIEQNNVLEFTFTCKEHVPDPLKVNLAMRVASPDGRETRVPGFWAGENKWKVRFASPRIGTHAYKTECASASGPSSMDGLADSFEVVAHAGTNPLYTHGRLRVTPDKKHLQHADGVPFFWLGDTWWMGFTSRLHWPDEFAMLTADRVKKGFTLVQIVAGLYPDMPWHDERGANEAGFPWDKDFKQINPAYFDMVDRRVRHLVNNGIVPCIVGAWGYFIDIAGEAVLEDHWRYLVARYGAFPVTWCIAGEAMMPYYLDRFPRREWNSHERPRRLAAWSRLASLVKDSDPFHNLVTIHPTRFGHEQLDTPALLDINMLQTGHANASNELDTIDNTVKFVRSARKHHVPVIVGEACYEGIMEANRQEIQRCLFWASMLSGCAGHTYGANGIWQINRRDRSYGESPHGASWGSTPWEEAFQLPGSAHVGASKKILCGYPWWQLQPHPEWVKGTHVYAAGIPGQLRIAYSLVPGRVHFEKLERDVIYDAAWIDPKDGSRYPIGPARPGKNGRWITPAPRIFQDWLVALERETGGQDAVT
ncbi:MAG: DUF4038 domain-containing protein [Candidatus Lokiarchaeota archaeon]|nr:DUF4038 domain-containing protein [Candidatus Lokiarchaeota archaeon]